MLGAGETTRLVAKYLYEHQLKTLTVISRDRSRAETLAATLHAQAGDLSELETALQKADILISATQSTLPLVGKGLIERVQAVRQYRPLMLIDLALPRDIEAEVSTVTGVTLYTLDDFKKIATEHNHARAHAKEQALMAIHQEAKHYFLWLKQQESTVSIQTFRDHVAQIREEVLTKAKLELQQGKSPESTLEKLAYQLTNKILHRPTLRLRQAGQEGEKGFLASIQALFKDSS